MTIQTINQAIMQVVERQTNETCFKIKHEGHYRSISYGKFYGTTLRLAKFLREQGVADGERVALAAYNCPQWLAFYMATLLAGGVAVPLRPSLAEEVLHFSLRDCGAKVVLLDEPDYIQAVIAERGRGGLPDLGHIVSLTDSEPLPQVVSIWSILAENPPFTTAQWETFHTQAARIRPERLALIKYTAGEAGRPRGAMFDHGQQWQMVQRVGDWFTPEMGETLFTLMTWSYTSSLLPTLHVFLSGGVNALLGSVETVAEDMRQTSPVTTINMPYFFERFQNGVVIDFIDELPEASQEVFRWALAKGKEFLAAGPAASAELREAFNGADMTYFTKIRGLVGGRLRYLYSTGAPLPQTLADFFEVVGLLPLNVYHMTEAGGFPAVSRPDARRPGACGQVAPGFEIRIAEDNEVLIRGATITRGYWQQPEETARLLDDEGWLHTDDLGHLDEDGFLYLTGRKQASEMLTTGRKIIPTIIENALLTSPLIDQAAVFADGRPYVSALIVPNLDSFEAYFDTDEVEPPLSDEPALCWFWFHHENSEEAMVTEAHPRIKRLLDQVIDETNKGLDRWERIGAYCLLDQADSPAARELAALQQGERAGLHSHYARQVESLYPTNQHIDEAVIDQVEVSPERMRDLLEKESILDAWIADAGIEFLIRMAERKQIDAPSMVHICDVAAMIAQMENEERPLSTALIVGDPAHIARVLPPSQIQLLRHDHIRRMRGLLTTLAKVVDGMVLGFILDRHGYVRGIHNLEISAENSPASRLWGPQFRRQAAISQACQAMVLYIPAGGRQVRVFTDGQLIGRYANGDWSQDRMAHLDETVTQLAGQGYDLALVQRVLGCAFRMAEQNLGAIFIIGDAERVLEQSDAPEISHFAWIASANVGQMSDQALINFAKEDGATVIDRAGRFRSFMVFLRPGAETAAQIGPGKGARHSSAAKMSAEVNCLAITVSQDGPITIYEGGRRVLSV